jgi:hypothetical protein
MAGPEESAGLQEYARHTGHLDVAREPPDGTAGGELGTAGGERSGRWAILG